MCYSVRYSNTSYINLLQLYYYPLLFINMLYILLLLLNSIYNNNIYIYIYTCICVLYIFSYKCCLATTTNI